VLIVFIKFFSGRTFRAEETSEKEATGATDGLTFMSFFV